MGLRLSDEQALIDGCKKCEPLARKQLYEKYAAAMFALCSRYAPDRSGAEDILQDGFLTIFTKIGTYSGKGSFEGWMRRIFVNHALAAIRRETTSLKYIETIDYEDDWSDAEASVIDTMSADEITACIAELPAGYRMVFNLYAIEGYSHSEIAGMLGIKESGSRSQYSHARQMLREKLLKLKVGK